MLSKSFGRYFSSLWAGITMLSISRWINLFFICLFQKAEPALSENSLQVRFWHQFALNMFMDNQNSHCNFLLVLMCKWMMLTNVDAKTTFRTKPKRPKAF